MNRMYSVPEQGQPFRFHDLCGMAEFTFHLRMAYETLTRGRETRPNGQASTSRDRIGDRDRSLGMASTHEPSRVKELLT